MAPPPQPLDTAGVALPADLLALTELLARHTHDTWARQRLADGWRYGPRRDDVAKEHPALVPYDELPECEKEYDRATALGVLRALVVLGYRIERPAAPAAPTRRNSRAKPHDGVPELPAEMAGYATEQFVLADELHGLARVQRAGAVEAEIFYAARLLEALAADALRALQLPPTTNAFANLETLRQLGLLPVATGHWAHALRRTGNAVRHVQRRVGPGDAELAALFCERWLVWFFREFSHGPRLRHLQPACVCLHPAGVAARALMTALEEDRFRHHDLLRQGTAAGLRAPALPAVAAEILIDRKDFDGAHQVLAAALDVFPDDVRLNQLMGLRWSRAGELERARAWLEPLYQKYHDDDETAGITAGVYKRLWHADRAARDWLVRAHRAYLHGWERARHTNAYLGINAATTALWLGREGTAREIAQVVRDLLTHRAALLAQGRGDGPSLGYWDQVTLAEALVLLRDLPAAQRAYCQAVERAPGQRAWVEVTRGQLEHLLQTLGLPARPDEFLDPPTEGAS